MKLNIFGMWSERHKEPVKFYSSDINELTDSFIDLVTKESRHWKGLYDSFVYKDLVLKITNSRNVKKAYPDRYKEDFEELYKVFEDLRVKINRLIQYRSILTMAFVDPTLYISETISGVPATFYWQSDEERLGQIKNKVSPTQFSFIEKVENDILIALADKVINNI